MGNKGVAETMTPEEIEELRALAVRLRRGENHNMAAILEAALEHIDQQNARLTEYRKPMESMDTEQLTDWNVKLTELLYAPDSEREYLPWQIAVGDHLEKFAESWHSSRIAELEAQIIQQTGISANRMEERERLLKQITALQEIAEEERGRALWFVGDDPEHPENLECVAEPNLIPESVRRLWINAARRQLSEEHPEAFR